MHFGESVQNDINKYTKPCEHGTKNVIIMIITKKNHQQQRQGANRTVDVAAGVWQKSQATFWFTTMLPIGKCDSLHTIINAN